MLLSNAINEDGHGSEMSSYNVIEAVAKRKTKPNKKKTPDLKLMKKIMRKWAEWTGDVERRLLCKVLIHNSKINCSGKVNAVVFTFRKKLRYCISQVNFSVGCQSKMSKEYRPEQRRAAVPRPGWPQCLKQWPILSNIGQPPATLPPYHSIHCYLPMSIQCTAKI